MRTYCHTSKGRHAAGLLSKHVGITPDVIETLSRIARLATTHTRLAELVCSVELSDRRSERVAREDARIEAAITRLVGTLPHTDHGPIVAVFSGDPRGYTVKLRVPGAERDGNTWGLGGEYGIGGVS